MAERVQVIVETKDASSGVLRSISNSWTEFRSAYLTVVGAIQQGARALEEVYGVARQGAEIEFLANRFDRLAVSIGTTADVLLDDLRVATRGTMSDMELMASVTDLVGLGLANSHDEALRLAKVSAGLNMNMNQLVLTLTNMTTMRFDALGVRVDGFKDKVKELEEQGYSTDAAFKEAFLQQAEEQLITVGNAADEDIGTFKRFEAQTQNNKNALMVLVGDGLEPLIDKQLDNIDLIKLGTELYAQQTGELILSRAQYQMHKDEILKMVEAYQQEQSQIKENITARDNLGIALMAEAARAEEVKQIYKEMNSVNTEQLSLIGKIQSEEDRYQEQKLELAEERKTIAGWDLEALEENSRKTAENEAAHDKASKTIILGLLEQKLTADGILTDDELNWLLAKGQAWGIYSQTVIDESKRAIDEANKISEAVSRIPEHKRIAIEFSVNNLALQNELLRGGYADGGISTGPKSGHLELLHGTEAVVPLKNGSIPVEMNGGSGGVNLNFTYAPMMSLANEAEIRDRLLPAILQGVDEARAQGRI